MDPYYQGQQCRPINQSINQSLFVSGNKTQWLRVSGFWKYKVHADIRGDYSRRRPQMRVGLSTTAIFGDLSGSLFGNFRHKVDDFKWRHAGPSGPVIDCKMNDVEWLWFLFHIKIRFLPALLDSDRFEFQQVNHVIAKVTARCAQHMSALKIVGLCKRKISRRLRKNLHITILSLIRQWNYLRSIPFDVITARSSDLNVTDGQTDGHCGITAL